MFFKHFVSSVERWIQTVNIKSLRLGSRHTHTHKKEKLFTFMSRNKKQETNTPVCVSVVAAHTRPLKDLAVVHLCVPLSY